MAAKLIIRVDSSQENIFYKLKAASQLPKYHCELNFIDLFWGTMKRSLWEHSDRTYITISLWFVYTYSKFISFTSYAHFCDVA